MNYETSLLTGGERVEGLDAFREARHVHMDTEIEIKEWWYPYG